MSTEADIVPERLWCTACGAVTRDRICDCNDYPEGHEMRREPHFVNYADQINSDFMECRKELLEAQAEITKLRAERDAAVENVLAAIDPWTRGAFTGWVGKTYRSRITLDRAEDHFTECMRDMKDDVRAKLTGAPALLATEGDNHE